MANRKSLSQSTPRSQLSQFSQQTQASQQSPSTQLSATEVQSLARDVVRYMLMQDYDKYPIKDVDIKTNVLKHNKRNAKVIMTSAKKMMRDVFGMDMFDVTHGTVKQYVVVNTLPDRNHIALSPNDEQELGLLTIVLSFIFMTTGKADGSVEEGKLAEFLNNLDIDVEGDHPLFGDIKRVFEKFRSQRYLNLIKIPGSDPPRVEYEWGERAKKEISLRTILEFVSEIYETEGIEKWNAHYEVVQQQENANPMNISF